MLPRISREPININKDNGQNEAPKTHHDKYINNNDTQKDSFSSPVGLTVAIQHEDGEPWMHKVIEKVNNSDHNVRSHIK